MHQELITIWQKFAELKKLQLHPPASEATIQAVEETLGFVLPEGLRELYFLADGQRDRKDMGIFKNVSGANVYSRVWFLSVGELATYYELLCSNPDFQAEFGKDFLPFAVQSEEYLGYCYAISLKDGSINMLWTDYTDPFLPVEWQLNIIKRGETMLKFLEQQNSMLF